MSPLIQCSATALPVILHGKPHKSANDISVYKYTYKENVFRSYINVFAELMSSIA